MMRNQIIESIEKEKIIVIVRGVEREQLIPLAEAMYRGGIRLLEVTYSANGSVSDEETADRIGMLQKHFGDRMHIGAGTVLTPRQVRLTAQAGGRFIISPNTKREVIEETVRLGLVSMPGAYTPSEIEDAHEYGADLVKLFPATSLGADYVKAVKAPLSHIRLLAVGGIDLNNISEYLRAGASGFGMASNIVDKKLLAARDYDGITELAARYVAAVKQG